MAKGSLNQHEINRAIRFRMNERVPVVHIGGCREHLSVDSPSGERTVKNYKNAASARALAGMISDYWEAVTAREFDCP